MADDRRRPTTTDDDRRRPTTTDDDRRRPTTTDESRLTKDDRRVPFVLLKLCPRGAPVRIAKRTNWLLERGRASRVFDAHRQGQFVSLTLVRTGGPRRRRSTTGRHAGATEGRADAERAK
jgi:hypothetical protein